LDLSKRRLHLPQVTFSSEVGTGVLVWRTEVTRHAVTTSNLLWHKPKPLQPLTR
jgi:hypothetical protein